MQRSLHLGKVPGAVSLRTKSYPTYMDTIPEVPGTVSLIELLSPTYTDITKHLTLQSRSS